MKKRTVTKLLSCALAFSMVATAAPVTAWASEVPAAAEEEAPEAEDAGGQENPEEVKQEDTKQAAPEELGDVNQPEDSENAEAAQETATAVPQAEKAVGRSVIPDGKMDAWAQDPETVIGDDSVNETESSGFLHLKAGSGNRNHASNKAQYPAVFVNPNTFDFTKDGFFEFDLYHMLAKDKSRFGVYLDYEDPGKGMFLGHDPEGWFWQKYTGGGNGQWFSGGRVASPDAGKWVKVRIDWTANGEFSLTVDGTKIFQNEASGLTHKANGKIAFKCAGWTDGVTDVYLNNIYYSGQEAVDGYHITGKVVDAAGNPVSGAVVTAGKQTAETREDGTFSLEVLDGVHDVTIHKEGYLDTVKEVTVDGADVAVSENIVLQARGVKEKETLETEDMSVQVARNFPSIIQYDMKKGELAGKTFYGQVEEINTIKINGVDIAVDKEDVTSTFTDTKATYEMTLQGQNVDCDITAEISVKDNTASFDITKVENKLTEKDANGYLVYPVQTIEIPNHSMISVNSDQESAHLKGAKMSSYTTLSGDKDFDVTPGMKLSNNALSEDFIYGFVSNSEMSAGLWSNSENNGSTITWVNTSGQTKAAVSVASGGAANTRVIATATTIDDVTNLGLSSAKWYYDRKVTTDVVVGNNDRGSSQTERRTYVVEHEIMPSAKVVIAGDVNEDDDIDWQDGAVAFRSIMHNPNKCEEVPELVNYRIAMNFGSHAANPFLTNLDGVKRVYLNTEGLGQGVLLKGYGSEGHDSGHPDYGDIGKRIGGADDMNTLLVEGGKMGAKFGVHINASEMYTEAKAFCNELSRGYAGIASGWNWLDQGIGINSRYDLATGSRQARFKDLHDQVGNNLDFIYVDVWGNGVSNSGTDGENFEDAWASRMLFREISGLGWRVTTEWGPTGEYDSTLQHWAADLGYGGFTSKGENSEVMRFLRNHQKDSWIADYPRYGAAAQAPLLGGLNMTDFEGWQGRTDYKRYITVMFRHNLITKYLQHYQVVDWVDGEPFTFTNPQADDVQRTLSWTPEMQITLRNTKDADDNTELVVSRKTDDISNLADYRTRTITLNGVTISEGAVTGGDGSNPGDEKYLIPWNWDSNGKELPDEDKKLYHWNTRGGDSEWTLTEDWQGLSNVVLYKLTDEGKKEKTVIDVVDGKISLEGIEAEIPYVIYKGERAPLAVDWQTSKYVYDMGFNDPDVNSHRTVSGDGTASIVDNGASNNMLKLEGQVSVSTKLTNLRKGQKYALYVGVDNRSDSKAHMTVKFGSKVLATNYATRSFAPNYVASDQHNNKIGTVPGTSGSNFQNMFVFFTAEGATATLSFDREAGAGATYLDDIRVVETKMDPIVETNEEGVPTALFNDFEDNAQGIWPFVVSSIEGVQDNRTHLSERHDQYTQAGYMCKKVDDVIDGNWSLKTNGLSQYNNLVYQTIPQNFHFEPGETYHVSFDYQMGSDGVYEVRLGDGTNRNVKSWALPGAAGETKRFGGSFVAGESGNNWIGIFSTTKATIDGGYVGKNLDFAGYKDFILDNIRIEKGAMSINETYTEVTTAENKISLSVEFDKWVSPNTKVTWTSSDESVARVNEKGEVYFVGFGSALINATANINGEDMTLTSMVYYPHTYEKLATFRGAWANANHPGEGPSNVLSGSGLWHTPWSGFAVSASNPAVITVQFDEDFSEFETVYFQQRPSGSNGLVKKYECIVGDSFDSSTHQIGGTDGEDRFTTGEVTTKKPQAGEKEILELPEGTKGHYLQIRVVQGNTVDGGGPYAALSRISLETIVPYDTPEERAFMAANAELFAESDLAAAKEQLKNAIANAKDTFNGGESLYSNETWTAFADAYQAAQSAYETGALQEVKDAKAALVAAQDNLKLLSETGKELDNARKDLRAAIELTKPIYEAGRGDYSAASWEAFEDAYTEAKVGLDSESISKVRRLTTALLSAKDQLTEEEPPVEDTTVKDAQDALRAEIDIAAPVITAGRGNYTTATWSAFEEAYDAARAGMTSTSVTKLNRLKTELKAAREALAEGSGSGTDVTGAQNALKAAVDAAKRVLDEGKKNYTNASWSAFEAAYDAAKAGETSTSITTLTRLKAELEAAQAGLKEGSGSGSDSQVKDAQDALKAATDAAKRVLDEGKKNYTMDSWLAFEAAYDAAKAGEVSTSITTLTRLKAELEAAQAGLKEGSGSGSDSQVKDAQDALKAATDAAKRVLDEGRKNYTNESWSAFEAAYDAAKAGETSTSITTLTRLKAELEAAQSNLKESEDTSEIDEQLEAARAQLQEAIDQVKQTYNAGQKNFTDASWEAFESNYVRSVKAVKGSASASKMKRLAKNLANSHKALEENPKAGDTFEVKNVSYKVTNVSKKTVTAVKGTNNKVTSISIASTVKFRGVTFKVTAIEKNAFKNFASLKKATIGSYVQTIKSGAFTGCKKLSQVSIGKKVNTIDSKAFYGCKDLTKVVFLGTGMKKVGSQAFKGTNAKLKVTLPAGTTTKKRNSLKLMLRKAGMSTTATVK